MMNDGCGSAHHLQKIYLQKILELKCAECTERDAWMHSHIHLLHRDDLHET